MKRLKIYGLAAACTLVLGGLSSNIAKADPDGSNPNSAEITRDAGCLLFDGNGDLVFADSDKTVVTNSGNGTLTCEASGVAPAIGGAAVLKGFLCSTFAGLTTETRSVVTPSGNSKLVCHVK